ncbi:MAG: hypothetical protein Q4G28_11000 [Neisseria sp.]|nr:hypothetical protein [Neisseria sp.]
MHPTLAFLKRTADEYRNGALGKILDFRGMNDREVIDHAKAAMYASVGIIGSIGKSKVGNQWISAGNTATSSNNAKQTNPYGVPVPQKVTAANGLQYQSNIKHSGRGVGAKAGDEASIEPKNSLDLFNASIPTTNSNRKTRYSYDGGVLHQFFDDGNGVYHWAGTKGKTDFHEVPIDVRRKLGINSKKFK